MPLKPKTICNYPGCSNLSYGSHCDKHRKEIKAARNKRHAKYYNRQWQKARAIYLRAHPLCVHCEEAGRLTPATEVDHIIPHRGDKALFWDRSNWQSLCKRCHSRKTVMEGGAFGKPESPRGSN